MNILASILEKFASINEKILISLARCSSWLGGQSADLSTASLGPVLIVLPVQVPVATKVKATA